MNYFLGGGGGGGVGLTLDGGLGLICAPSFVLLKIVLGGGGLEPFLLIFLLPCFLHKFYPFYIFYVY